MWSARANYVLSDFQTVRKVGKHHLVLTLLPVFIPAGVDTEIGFFSVGEECREFINPAQRLRILHHIPVAEVRIAGSGGSIAQSILEGSDFIDKTILEKWYNDKPGGSLHDVYVVEIENVYSL